ncbi:MAG: hypothetical protein AB1898_02775 [Acidobacteriota bacterium]
MLKCKSCGKRVSVLQLVRNSLLIRNWKVTKSSFSEVLCLECVASWNTYYEGFEKQHGAQEPSRNARAPH